MMILRVIRLQSALSRKYAVRTFATRSVTNLFDRGFVKEVFPPDSRHKIEEITTESPQSIYAGFDPTADSLHIGNLLVIIGLLHFQRAGHHPIALVGGATGIIGDPSGKSTERNALETKELKHNLSCIKKQLHKIFDNHRKYLWNEKVQGKLNAVKYVDNAEWYEKMSFLDFIGSIGRHFRLGDMLNLTSVRSRMESDEGISFTEFSYQVCQSYDWWQLFKHHKCRFQLGGADQLGNISAGYRLIKRLESNKNAFGITIPILTTRDGKKLGKSEGNAIWLHPEKTSPFSLYQFFVRTPDDEVENLLKMLSFFSLEEINEIMIEQNKATHLRLAPKKLAEQLTLLIHGEDGLKKAQQVTAALYDGDFAALSSLSQAEMKSIFVGAKVHEILLEPGMTVLDLVLKAKIYKHDREAMRYITQGGFYINQNRCKNIAEVISPAVHILANNFTLLRTGSRNYFIISWRK
ncbi:tyrosine--tRNA ligase, mitochondrial [Sitodiplosis mosellana]|uniref:tyrosine--tRNA ligase, mitochondrial n=1 Tax=Sitodiplosis mosellana TaxID=263140 RepID=UPI002443939C|nr:tyrosine--tRNA ligase, mitochondrial [Sitodiplosis mosellana]